jgi:high-affinity iron transporter
MRRLQPVLALFALLALFTIGKPIAALAQATPPGVALHSLTQHIDQALEQVSKGDLAAAKASLDVFHSNWGGIEDAIRDLSPAGYLAIEDGIDDADAALARGDAAAARTALEELDEACDKVSAGQFAGGPALAPATLPDLLAHLDTASAALTAGDAAAATAALHGMRDGWLSVESMVKGRSADVYRSTETNLAQAISLVEAGNLAAARPIVTQLHDDLAPMVQPTSYGVFDAMAILLREGLEVMLVFSALLMFLNRSGNGDKRGWIWAGGLVGVVASIGLALSLVLVFQSVTAGTNRELVEGITGLVAAVMLFSVSYWLHGKSNVGAWQTYIRQQTRAALAGGRLFSLAFLAFLAVFREGAETTLFYIGIAPSLATSDLLLGIGLALAILAVAGGLIFVIGVRLPLRPCFLIASGLIFYLGFKFIGTGIHALQAAQVLPTHPAGYLPDVPALGVYPTWETLVPQVILLVVALFVIFVLPRIQVRSQQPATV